MTPQSDFEIGREQFDLIPVGLDQDIRENRDRVLSLDDSLEQLQFAKQIGLAYDQFHVGDDLWGRRRKIYDGRADSFNVEGDQETKNYNKKEVLLKTRKRAFNPCLSAI